MENASLEKLIQNYKLSKAEHIKVLENLKKSLFKGKKIASRPIILFVVGQPGSGKTTFIQNSDFSNFIIINSDEYRHLNKYSEEILLKYPTNYSKLTNFDAHLWGDELFHYAIESGYSVLREKAPVDLSLIDVIKTKSQNCEIEVNIIVEGDLSSLLRTRERYEEERLVSRYAKLSNIDSHNKCYQLLPNFILNCLSMNVKVCYVVSENNRFQVIPVSENSLELLNHLREKSNMTSILSYDQRMGKIKSNMINRNASRKEWEELQKVENLYLKLVNKNGSE